VVFELLSTDTKEFAKPVLVVSRKKMLINKLAREGSVGGGSSS